MFSEPAWDILLDLLRAEISRRAVSVTDLYVASGVPAATAYRCLKSMERCALITRRGDPSDKRRIFVELEPDASRALRLYFANVIQLGGPG